MNIGAQPFVKWPGTKSQHLHILTQALPANFAEIPDVTYIEPFVGGGALLFHMLQTYPNIRLVIAHVGRAYVKEDVGDAFEYLNQAPDLMYDFCANCCEYAITEVIRNAGPKHVMFGLDLPILRMRTHRIEENGTYINLIPPGMYGDPSQDSHLREVSPEEAEKITFFAYEELLAFKRAAKTLGLTKQDIEDIMYNNAANLVEGARRDIYGE